MCSCGFGLLQSKSDFWLLVDNDTGIVSGNHSIVPRYDRCGRILVPGRCVLSRRVVRRTVCVQAAVHQCSVGACLDGSTCGVNRRLAAENPLCGQCLDGYYEWAGTCVSCEGGSSFGFVLLLVSVLEKNSFGRSAN